MIAEGQRTLNYWAAWGLLLESKAGWKETAWKLAAVGDANFLVSDLEISRDNLSHAIRFSANIDDTRDDLHDC